MITLGVDAHKAIHVAVAVDEAGRELGKWRGPNTPDAWASLERWAAAFGPDSWWGVEGAWGNGRGLSKHLVLVDECLWTALWSDRSTCAIMPTLLTWCLSGNRAIQVASQRKER